MEPQEEYVDDPDMGWMPLALRDRIHYVIEHSVDKRVNNYMNSFRKECAQELLD